MTGLASGGKFFAAPLHPFAATPRNKGGDVDCAVANIDDYGEITMPAFRIALALCIGAAAAAGPVHAQSGPRNVVINGERMSPFGLALADTVNCGQPVPDGRYWINWATRSWGHEGSRTAAPLPDCARAGALAPRAQAGGRGGSWEDRTHENLCLRGGRCDVDIVINPVYQ